MNGSQVSREQPGRRIALALIVVGVLAVFSRPDETHVAVAQAAPRTATRVVVDRVLGLRMLVPTSWKTVKRAKNAPLGLAFTQPAHRLSIEVFGTTTIKDPARAAQAWVCGLQRIPRGRGSRAQWVRYAGTRGIMLTRVPGIVDTVDFVLVHQGVVFHFVMFGRSLTADQRAVMASLRFVPRVSNSPVTRVPQQFKPCPAGTS